MAQAVLYSKTGTKKDAPVKLSAGIFGVEPNHQLLNTAYQIYLGNGRGGHAQTLTRGEVRGGGKKPWRQKGTGRARAGSSRLPHWTGGGVAFGPTGEENYTRSLPVKAKRAAIRQALSLQAADKKIAVVEVFESAEGKVKPTVQLLDKIKASGRVLLVLDEMNDLLSRATRNLSGVNTVTAQYLNVYDILNADAIVITRKSLDQIESWLGEAKKAKVEASS